MIQTQQHLQQQTQNFMFQLQLYELNAIMLKKLNQVLKEQLIGKNMKQKYQ